MTKVVHVFTRSTDRNKNTYPSPSSYQITLPEKIDDVTQIQISTLELPQNRTHMTVEPDANDRIWFSEGLKLDLGESDGAGSVLRSDVDGIVGLNMSNNQLCLREADATNFVVGVPAYLCPITSVDSGTGIVTTLDSSANYACYAAWRTSVLATLNPPAPRVVCASTTYEELFDGATSTVRVLADASQFANSFVHCPPLSVEELCDYLTFAFQNYTTYFGATRPRLTYQFIYSRGRVQIDCGETVSAVLHFPTTVNAALTAHYGTQYPEFATRMALNSVGGNVTSLGYMLGFASPQARTTWVVRTDPGIVSTHKNIKAGARPRFLFEARLRPGIYSQQTLSTSLPIAMNPLAFPDTTGKPGCGYFGFRDSLGVEKLVLVSPGQYTPETFGRALSYLLTRLDSQGLFHASSRFSYRGTPLDAAAARPSLDLSGTVAYNVRYDYVTAKFTIEAKYTSDAQPNDPSGNPVVLDAARPGPIFALYFRPATLAKIATQIADLSTLASSSQVDRFANVLGFEIRDYVGKSSYASDFSTYLPFIPTTLSQGGALGASRPGTLASSLPTDLGLSSAPYGAGPSPYMHPSGRYSATGNSPSTNGLNLTVNSDSGAALPPTFQKKAKVRTDGLKVTVANDGALATDYSIAAASANYSTNSFVVGDATYTSPLRPSNVLLQVSDASYASGSAVQGLSLVHAGSGLDAASDVSFNAIPSYQALRKGVVSASTTDTTATFSSHKTHQSSTGLAATTGAPLGFQVGEVVQIRCAQEALCTDAAAVVGQVTLGAASVDRGFPFTTYTHSGVYTLVAGNYHVVLGGDYDAVLRVVTDASGVEVLSTVESGSNYYSGDTYYLSKPIRYAPFSAVVTQLPNAGAQFVDSTNASGEQFYSTLPLLGSATSCVPSRYSDGTVVRARIPSSLIDNGFGHFQSTGYLDPVRTAFHVEDETTSGTRAASAHQLVGIGPSTTPMAANVEFPNHMDLAPVPYILVCFPSMGSYIQTQLTDDLSGRSRRDVVGKIVIGAPVAMSKTSPMSIYLNKAQIRDLTIEFRLPDNETLYNFHGVEHTLTLSFVTEPR